MLLFTIESGHHIFGLEEVLVRLALAIFRNFSGDVFTIFVEILDPQAIGILVFVGTHHAKYRVAAFCEFPFVAFAHECDVLHRFFVENAFGVSVLVKSHSVEVSSSEGELHFGRCIIGCHFFVVGSRNGIGFDDFRFGGNPGFVNATSCKSKSAEQHNDEGKNLFVHSEMCE